LQPSASDESFGEVEHKSTSFSKNIVAAIIFGRAWQEKSNQYSPQLASRHQQILKDNDANYCGPFQMAASNMLHGRRGYTCLSKFFGKVARACLSFQGYTKKLECVSKSLPTVDDLLEQSSIDHTCAITLAFDNINWADKASQQKRMPDEDGMHSITAPQLCTVAMGCELA
jgi:hypothetical protein